MINYIAHWDRILIQSRVEIINELKDYEFRSICPIVDDRENQRSLFRKLNWRISRN